MLLFLLICLTPAAAEAVDAPVLSFSQQVEIVVDTKKDPRVLDMKIRQEDDTILIDFIVDRNQDREEVKQLALNVVMLTKMRSLDDRPKTKDKPGKGLYNYIVTIARPDGVVLLTAIKPKKKEIIRYEDQDLHPEPLTRADAAGR